MAYRTEPAEGGQYRGKLRVHHDNVADDFQMFVPVTLDLGNDRVAGFGSRFAEHGRKSISR